MLGGWDVLRYGDEVFVLSGRTVLETLLASRPHLLCKLAAAERGGRKHRLGSWIAWIPILVLLAPNLHVSSVK